MKLRTILLTCIFIIMLGACSSREKDKPSIPITASSTEVQLEVGGAPAVVTLNGGNGSYSANSGNSAIATAIINLKTLTITPVKAGETFITVTSAGQKIGIKVIVKDKVPSLNTFGIYKGNELILKTGFIAKNKIESRITLTDTTKNLYSKFVKLYDEGNRLQKLKAEEQITLTFIHKGIPALSSLPGESKRTFLVEQVAPLQLKDVNGDLRILLR